MKCHLVVYLWYVLICLCVVGLMVYSAFWLLASDRSLPCYLSICLYILMVLIYIYIVFNICLSVYLVIFVYLSIYPSIDGLDPNALVGQTDKLRGVRSLLQYVAVCRNVLQCGAVSCSEFVGRTTQLAEECKGSN